VTEHQCLRATLIAPDLTQQLERLGKGIRQAAYAANALSDDSAPFATMEDHLPDCSDITTIPGGLDRILELYEDAIHAIGAFKLFSKDLALTNLFVTLWTCAGREDSVRQMEILLEQNTDTESPGLVYSNVLLSFGMTHRLINFFERTKPSSRLCKVQLARAYLAVGQIKCCLATWTQARDVKAAASSPHDAVQFERLTFWLFLELVHSPTDNFVGIESEFRQLKSELSTVSADYVWKCAAFMDSNAQERSVATQEVRPGPDGMRFEDAYVDVKCILDGFESVSPNVTTMEYWVQVLMTSPNQPKEISPKRTPWSFYVSLLACHSNADFLTLQLKERLKLIKYDDGLYETTRIHLILSAAILKSSGRTRLTSYWAARSASHTSPCLQDSVSFAESNSVWEELFTCWKTAIESYHNCPMYHLQLTWRISSIMSVREELCGAYIQRRDYISVIIIIESLLDQYGALPINPEWDDESYRKLHYWLSVAYGNMGMGSRSRRFMGCDTLRSRLDWVIKFGNVYGFSSEDSDGLIDNEALEDPQRWKIRTYLEFLTAQGRFDEAIETCEDYISIMIEADDITVTGQLLYYLACIHKSRGDATRAHEICCQALQTFPIEEFVPVLRKLRDDCWWEMKEEQRSRPPCYQRYPHGFCLLLDSGGYRSNPDPLHPFKLFRDFRAISRHFLTEYVGTSSRCKCN
jgi:hypothetical protein